MTDAYARRVANDRRRAANREPAIDEPAGIPDPRPLPMPNMSDWTPWQRARGYISQLYGWKNYG